MNLVAFGLILICCHAWAIEIDDNSLVGGTYARKTKLEDFLEKFKSTLRNGDSSLGIPSLDPFTMEKLPIKLEEDKIHFEGLLTNSKVDGLSEYTVNSADFKLLGLKFNVDINWPMIIATTNYTMNGTIMGLDIYGTGGIKATVKGFRFSTDVKLTLSNNHVQIKQMSTKIFLQALDFQATGLFNDPETSEILSKMISDMVPQIIVDSQEEIVDTVNKIIMNIGNEFLKTKTLKELLEILGL